jgi:hypothetical protein
VRGAPCAAVLASPGLVVLAFSAVTKMVVLSCRYSNPGQLRERIGQLVRHL